MYFLFILESLRWGPTSLQTVKRNVSGVYTVCTMLGAGNIKLKYALLRQKTIINFYYNIYMDKSKFDLYKSCLSRASAVKYAFLTA